MLQKCKHDEYHKNFTNTVQCIRLSFLCALFLLMTGSPDSDMTTDGVEEISARRNNCCDYITYDRRASPPCSSTSIHIRFLSTMDNFPDGIAPQDNMALSYDDTVAYEEQLPTEAERERSASLATRIGSSKVYLLSESSVATRTSKVR